MEKIKTKVKKKKMLADTNTPVGIYLKFRDHFPNSLLLESSDYHGNQNSYSFICLQPVSSFRLEKNIIYQEFPNGEVIKTTIQKNISVCDKLNEFISTFQIEDNEEKHNFVGLFGYTTYDAVQYFETIELKAPVKQEYSIPEICYSLYKYVIAINHFNNELTIYDYQIGDENSNIEYLETILANTNFAAYNFTPIGEESSNMTDEDYKDMVKKGKEHCKRGDVYQIVLSRQFSQKFKGDEFNVYRALRSVNPSPYLFYFDYGNYKIFGSSPEAQIVVESGKAIINPIAGTFKRTGNDNEDKKLAEDLSFDPKENAEHVMLVDLARNDLSRNAEDVTVDKYREIQFFSHVIHMVSKVTGRLPKNADAVKVMADTFPAGTLSGAPKYKAMELIDKYENQNRGYYGGCIGMLGFNGEMNQAIMIRSFLCKNNTLYYQAGAGVVFASVEENELNEVNNKLAALKNAINLAKNI